MSKFKKGKGKPRAGARQDKKKYHVEAEIAEVFGNFKLINENWNAPDPLLDEDDIFEYAIISKDWITKMETHCEGNGPFPKGTINKDLLDPEWHNSEEKILHWGKSRRSFNHILHKKAKFKKDYIICNEVAWEILEENFETIRIVRKFYIERNAYHLNMVVYDYVI